MIADVSGSAALYDEVGNTEAHKRVTNCLSLIRKVVEFHGGQFISSKGDDILCIFTDPQVVLEVGLEMFEATEDSALSVHAGVDYGLVIRTSDDVFGDSVNMAARLASVANSGEVLCSQNLYDKLTGSYRSMLRFFGPRHFKGKTATSNIYLFSHAAPGQATEIIFNDGTEAERDRAEAVRTDVSSVKVAVRFDYDTFVCSAERPITMGRSGDCDLVVPLPWVSRAHATIEIRGDKAYLSDTSTSGTYISFDGQDSSFRLCRESAVLHRPCIISLARPAGDPGAQIISCDLLLPANDPL